MKVSFNTLYLREGTFAAFGQLSEWEQRRVKGNIKEILGLLGPLSCAYHSRWSVRVFLSLHDGVIVNTVYACCPLFVSLLRQTLRNSTTPFVTVSLGEKDPALWN